MDRSVEPNDGDVNKLKSKLLCTLYIRKLTFLDLMMTVENNMYIKTINHPVVQLVDALPYS